MSTSLLQEKYQVAETVSAIEIVPATEKVPATEIPAVAAKRSTSPFSGDKKTNGTHIWAKKDPWSKPGDADSKSVKKTEKSEKTDRPKRPRSNKAEKTEKGAPRYLFLNKLMLEEDVDAKTVLIKISQRTSIR